MTTNIYAYEYSQSFETTIKNNNSVTTPSEQVLLVSESLKDQDNNTTNIP